MFDTIEDAINDLKDGKIIIVCDDESRENEGDFVALSSHATPEVVNFMINHGKGLLCIAIDDITARRLNLESMIKENTDNFKTAFTVSIDHNLTSTGISCSDRSLTINQMINPASKPEDFRKPGHMFPLVAKPHGTLERRGHTEAVVDLAKLAKDSKNSGIICEIINLDGTMARRNDLFHIAKQHNLKIISIHQIAEYRKKSEVLVKHEVSTALPTRFGAFEISIFSSNIDKTEFIVISKGLKINHHVLNTSSTNTTNNLSQDDQGVNPSTTSKALDGVLTRVHSSCVTGDIFHSKRCDCGDQLENSLQLIATKGVGLVIYLPQEGRGIGLVNKLKAYNLQNKGFDTFDANVHLGYAPDLREYHYAAHILKLFNIKSINIITNNPHKIEGLKRYGVKINRRIHVKLQVFPENQNYLKTKIEKFGHIL